MITIDTTAGTLQVHEDGGLSEEHPLGTAKAFDIISKVWLRSGWDNKYVYSFTWLGRPVVQLPEDLIRIQEVVYAVRPDVIIETGVAHGGSLIYYATLCHAMGKGRVIGVDIHIRPPNRAAIEAHRLAPLITLVEGSSVEPEVVSQIHGLAKPGETVLVLLDSCHTKAHVLAELDAFAPLVSVGSYLVAMDGIMGDVVGAPRTSPDWSWNNPKQAALDFVARCPEFAIEEPAFLFNEGSITQRVTYSPCAFIKRVSPSASK